MTRLKIPPVIKMPIEVQATSALRESIISGALSAGSRITEMQISQQMNLSRTTVRMALHQLAKEGLLNLVPYTGWTVVSLSPHDVWELYTLRSAIERLASQLVASSMTSEKALRLDESFELLVHRCKSGNTTKIADADFALHETIIELSGHSRLVAQYALIEQQTRMCIRSSDALVASARKIINQHRPIVEAIRSGKVELSGRLAEEHNLVEGDKLSKHLKSQECEVTPDIAARKRARTRRNPAEC